MLDPPFALSAGSQRQSDVKAPGALLTFNSIEQEWLFTAASVDGKIVAGNAATIATTAIDLAERMPTGTPKTILTLGIRSLRLYRTAITGLETRQLTSYRGAALRV
jgi:hypothetical protein